jgi:hypothetical protein
VLKVVIVIMIVMQNALLLEKQQAVIIAAQSLAHKEDINIVQAQKAVAQIALGAHALVEAVLV